MLSLGDAVVEPAFDSVSDAFPEVDPGVAPCGGRILVQIRNVTSKTKSGLYLVEDTTEAERWNTTVAKVIALGPLAYRKKDTMDPWPEGQWAKVGEFVRVPKYGGDRWCVKHGDNDILFVIINDFEVIGKITGDPLKVRVFL